MNKDTSISKTIISAIALIIGLFLLGFFIFKGLKTFSDKDRVVTVKGLAEMNIEATSATISLDFNYSSDDLKDIIQKTETKKNEIIKYLTQAGYNKNDINIQNINVIDKQKYYETEWANNKEVQVKIDRYQVTQRLSVTSKNTQTTENEASQINLELINKDLTCNISTDYLFPELNSIKPKLIAESTKNARIAGEQFANDSQAQLGKIKTASQGQITIAGKYYYEEEQNSVPQEPYIQKARVVSTIVFFLE